MSDLQDQLRAYGRRIEQDLGSARPKPSGGVEGSPPDRPANGDIRRPGSSSWLLIAAATALIALTTSLLFPSAFLEGSLLSKKGTSSVLGVCLIAAACTAGGQEPSPPTGSPTHTSPSAVISTLATGPPSLFADTGTVQPGTYVVDRLGVPITITVPAGWSTYSDFNIDGADESFLAFFDITEVPADACRWDQSRRDPGPSVDDLVTAMTTQQNSEVTAPQPRDLDGHRGVYLEIQKPATYDLTKCDEQSLIGWFDREAGMIPTVGHGALNAMWVLDLNGKRGVITWGYYGVPSEQTKAEILGMVQSLSIG